jgi:hypothetical protein
MQNCTHGKSILDYRDEQTATKTQWKEQCSLLTIWRKKQKRKQNKKQVELGMTSTKSHQEVKIGEYSSNGVQPGQKTESFEKEKNSYKYGSKFH